MGRREIVIRESVATSIAEASWFIESKGLLLTAEKFSDAVYDFIEELADSTRIHALCRDPVRNSIGYKCKNFGKYTIVFIETAEEVIVCEFLPSKMIKW